MTMPSVHKKWKVDFAMKPRLKPNASPTKPRNKVSREPDQPVENRRRVWLWLVAVFLAVTFLAGECATLLPVE